MVKQRQSLAQGLSATLARKFVSDPNSVITGINSDAGKQTQLSHTLPIEKIQLPLKQPRRYFDPEKQIQLTESIQEYGILEPLLLRQLENGAYELVAGERRYRAAQSLKLKEVPVVIKQLDDRQAIQVALIENLQRDDLNPIDETEAILELLAIEIDGTVEDVASVLHRANHAKNRGQDLEENVSLQFQTIEKVLRELGRFSPESFRTSRLPLLNLPDDVLTVLRQGTLEFTKARAIARVKDDTQRQKLLKLAIGKNLSLNQIKDQVVQIKEDSESSKLEVSMAMRLTQVTRAVNQAKVWDDPKKKRKLDKLIGELEALLAEG
jgi:ParB family transcriptional regulator, chromosome partitioning protein